MPRSETIIPDHREHCVSAALVVRLSLNYANTGIEGANRPHEVIYMRLR